MADLPDPDFNPDLPPTPPEETIAVTEKRIRRLSGALIVDAALGAFNAERGFLFTIREFVLRPRQAFEGYLGEDRMRYSNPLKMVIFLSAIAAFLMHQFPIMEIIQGRSGAELTAEEAEAAEFAQRNYNLLLLASLPVMAVVSRLFYWGRAYNLVEHIALNSFQVSVITVAYFIMLPAVVLWPNTVLVYLVLSLAYQVWLYRRVLGPGWIRAIIATLVVTVAYLTSMSVIGTIWQSLF